MADELPAGRREPFMRGLPSKEEGNMQEYKTIQITKEEVVPTALRMRHDGRWLVMIYGWYQTDGQLRISWDYEVGPVVESYYVLGEKSVPSIAGVYDEAARWPELELYELLGIEFEGLDTSKRLFLPENLLETQGKGQILVTPLAELVDKRDEMLGEKKEVKDE